MMRLRYDEERRGLVLVMTDLWDGQHERVEYPLTGDTARGREFDGARVISNGPGASYRAVMGDRKIPFDVSKDPQPVIKTPCRRMASKSGRAKCELCAEEGRS